MEKAEGAPVRANTNSNADVVACTRWLSHYSPTADNQGYKGVLVPCVKDLNGLRRKFHSTFQTYDLPPSCKQWAAFKIS